MSQKDLNLSELSWAKMNGDSKSKPNLTKIN